MKNVKKISHMILSVVVAFVLTLVSLALYMGEKNVHIADASNGITYYKHYYNNNNLTSYESYTLSFVPRADNATTCSVFPPNDMTRNYDEAVVRIGYPGGTGFIVGDHVIATAAHCVYSWQDRQFIEIDDLNIVDENNEAIPLTPVSAHIREDFVNSTVNGYSCDYDYALITVEEDLSGYAMFNLGFATRSYVSKKGAVIVAGFPQAEVDGYEGSKWGVRFQAKGNITGYSGSILKYNADSAPGDSGGPVYVEEGVYDGTKLQEYKTVIAINVAQESTVNDGVRITPDIMRFYCGNEYI